MKARIIGIQRYRMGTDGHGITTLVGFHGCPLHCQYCLNPQCHNAETRCVELSPSELFSFVKRDELYFLATHGGVTFGGGEPALYSSFIEEFRSCCGTKWMINVETSLNVPSHHLESLCRTADTLFVDIKDMNHEIYERYTKCDNAQVYDNLHLLSDFCRHSRPHPKVIIRVPYISGYNDTEDINTSIQILKQMGYTHFNKLSYNTHHGRKE